MQKNVLWNKKFFRDFNINGVIKEIELCPKDFGRKGGRVRVSMPFNEKKASSEMIYGIISVYIAGFIAAKLSCNFSYSSSELKNHTDYIAAYYYARILSDNRYSFVIRKISLIVGNRGIGYFRENIIFKIKLDER